MKCIKFLVALLLLIGIQIAPLEQAEPPAQASTGASQSLLKSRRFRSSSFSNLPLSQRENKDFQAQTQKAQLMALQLQNQRYAQSQVANDNSVFSSFLGLGAAVFNGMRQEATKPVPEGQNPLISRSLGVGAVLGGFFMIQMIETAKPTFAGVKDFLLDTFYWWRPALPAKVAPRIKTQKLAVEKMMDLVIDSEYLKKLTEGDTKIEVENIRDGAAHLSDEAKPLEKLLMTRSVNINFDMVRRMFVAQMNLTIFQLDTFVLKSAPSDEKEFIKKAILEIKQSINAVIAILDQKTDFKGFTDKDTKVELSTLKGLLTQLFNQLIGAFGVEAKDDTDKKYSW